MKQSTTWICDTCSNPIESANDGWVEWIIYDNARGNSRGRGLRLVHHVSASPGSNRYGCQYDEDREEMKDRGMLLSLGLTSLQGPDGLMCLLVKIQQDEIPRNQVLELIKRIHIPGYEHARFHFDSAMEDGGF